MADHHSALVYLMVLASAVDGAMTDREMHAIGDNVMHLPIFSDFDDDQLTKTMAHCAEILQKEKGFELVMKQIKTALPHHLRETGYALAAELVYCDGEVSPEGRRLLDIIRDRLIIEGTAAIALERAARARYAVL